MSTEAPSTGDAIARSKRILALVDACIDNHTEANRTALRVALMEEFAEPDAARLDALQANPRWHLDCEVLKFGKPGKWRVWKVLGNQFHSTTSKTLGEGDTLREAIDAALTAAQRQPTKGDTR
jgi:hypothetical protein